jgi:hypothetical protein
MVSIGRRSILRLSLSLDGVEDSPCDTLAAEICEQIPAEWSNFFKVELLRSFFKIFQYTRSRL